MKAQLKTMKQKQAPNKIIIQATSCCVGFLENQIGIMRVIKKALEEFDKETVIKQIDQILNYYEEKLAELPK
jgi:hypothetical protein